MKRLLACMLSLCLLSSLSACAPKETESSEPTSSGESIPSYIQGICDAYKAIADKYTTKYEQPQVYQSRDGQYYILLDGVDSIQDLHVDFYYTDKSPYKSFRLSLANKAYAFQGAIYATLSILEPSLDYTAAKERLTALLNTGFPEGETLSRPETFGDYTVYIERSNVDKAMDIVYVWDLYVFHKDELHGFADPADYASMDYEAARNTDLKENMGRKFYVAAKVTKNDDGYMLVEDGDGKTYRFSYSFERVPMTFAVGQSYTLYGTVKEAANGVPCLDLDYVK